MRSLFLLAVLAGIMPLFGQSAANDPTFNPGDPGFGIGSGFLQPNVSGSSSSPLITNGEGMCMIVLGGGKILVGGTWDASDPWLVKKLVRVNTDGSIDFTFNTGSGFNGDVHCILQQPDGKIMVGGSFTAYSGTPCNRICRLNSDGTFDASFAAVPGCDATVRDMLYVPGNKLVIGGDFTSAGGAGNARLARLSLNGADDPAFNAGGSGLVGQVNCLTLQGDGKILVGGLIASYNGVARNNLLRLNANGSLDGTYLGAAGAGPNARVHDIGIQGTFHWVCGEFGEFSGVDLGTEWGIVRISNTGVLGTLSGLGFGGSYRSLTVLAGGRVMVGGYTYRRGSWALQEGREFSSSGEAVYGLAHEYHLANPGVEWSMRCAAQQPDGKVVVLMESPFGGLVRFLADGTYDHGFRWGTGLIGHGQNTSQTDQRTYIERLSDDRLVIGGTATCNGDPSYMMTLRGADLQPDPGFDQGAADHGDRLYDIAIAPGDLIYMITSYWLFRAYELSGELTPHSPTGFDLRALFEAGAAFYPDGRFLLGGGQGYATRVMPSGTIDPTFAEVEHERLDYFATDVILRSDGHIYVAGQKRVALGMYEGYLVRLLPDGGLDPTFDVLGGFDRSVFDIHEQPDGKLLCVGAFTTYRGVSTPGLCRLNPDASLDATFNVGTGLDGAGWKVLTRPDGRILVSGLFSHYNGTVRGSLVSINADGSVDDTFDTGIGFQDNAGAPAVVSDFVIQSTGQVVAVGEFTQYQGIGRNRIVRLGEGVRASLRPRAFLEGCIASPLMCDELRLHGLIPLITPYRTPDLARFGSGSEMTSSAVLATQGADAIVDWVWVGLSTSPSRAGLVAARSALLQRDGDIVEMDGVSPLSFPVLSGNYHVIVRHRNHLGVVTANAYALSRQTTLVDFTSPNYPTHGTEAQKFQNGKYMLWAGDVGADGIVKYLGTGNDRDPVLGRVGGSVPTAIATGYWAEDVNMDGTVKYIGSGNDRDLILGTVGGNVPTAVRVGQLP